MESASWRNNMLRSLWSTVDDQCELIQDDLLCLFDGMSQEVLDKMCQIVVDRFQAIKDHPELI